MSDSQSKDVVRLNLKPTPAPQVKLPDNDPGLLKQLFEQLKRALPTAIPLTQRIAATAIAEKWAKGQLSLAEAEKILADIDLENAKLVEQRRHAEAEERTRQYEAETARGAAVAQARNDELQLRIGAVKMALEQARLDGVDAKVYLGYVGLPPADKAAEGSAPLLPQGAAPDGGEAP